METALAASPATAPVPALVRALFGIFVASGVCGLIYESIWSHYLKLFVGHAAYAQTVVLIVFIGGMAVGAWLVGRFIDRIASPLVGYAIVEGVVGLVSLVFHRLFVASTGRTRRCSRPLAYRNRRALPSGCSPPSDPVTVDPARHDLPADDRRRAATCAGRSGRVVTPRGADRC